jgi:hypothetical protein
MPTKKMLWDRSGRRDLPHLTEWRPSGSIAPRRYSVRNACIGSIRDALHAGNRQASADTTSSVAATVAKIVGSSDRVP